MIAPMPLPMPLRSTTSALAGAAASSGTVTGRSCMSDAEMDKLILKAAITNAALELLPESLATMAIIPLQVRLVYRIGKAYGYPMDTSHAKDFLATLGVGLTGAVPGAVRPQAARRAAGPCRRRSRPQRRPPGREFRPHVCHDLCLGRVAQRYYAAGRSSTRQRSSRHSLACSRKLAALRPGTRSRSSRKPARIDMRSLASLVRRAENPLTSA